MKKIVGFFLAVMTGLAFAGDIYTPYEGSTGMNCTWYNRAGAMKWNTAGGDHETEVVSLTTYKAYSNPPLVVDLTAAGGAEGVWMDGTSPLKIYSRNTTVGVVPTLLINGEPTNITVVADASLNCGTTNNLGMSELIDVANPFVMFFSEPLPTDATSITLTLDVNHSYSFGGTITAHKAVIPRAPDEAPLQGFAAGYNSDEGIETHPDVLLKIDMDDPDWKQYANHQNEGEHCHSTGSVNSIDGGRVIESIIDATLYGKGCSYRYYAKNWLPDNPEEVYLRYYVRLDANYYGSTDGGKMPGIAAEEWYEGNLLCGGGGTTCAGGKKGWTLRGGFDMNPDTENPIYPRVPFHTYAYHADQASDYGDFWTWGPRGIVDLERWTAIEWHVKVNTPGVNDGILQIWVDGKLALDRQDIQLRGPLPWDPRINDNMAAKIVPWIVHFYGGKNPPYVRDHIALFDKFVVATSYIGPLGDYAPPPPPPPTLEERVIDLERRVTDLENAVP